LGENTSGGWFLCQSPSRGKHFLWRAGRREALWRGWVSVAPPEWTSCNYIIVAAAMSQHDRLCCTAPTGGIYTRTAIRLVAPPCTLVPGHCRVSDCVVTLPDMATHMGRLRVVHVYVCVRRKSNGRNILDTSLSS